MTENYVHILEIAQNDVLVLKQKGLTYGSSWRQRGGVGAFMMLARKWDRIENQCREAGYDIFQLITSDPSAGGILDDIQDLRRYLLLVESFCTAPLLPKTPEAPTEPVDLPLYDSAVHDPSLYDPSNIKPY